MTSPAGKLSAGVFTTPNGSLAYTVSYDGRMVCDTSALGVTIDGADTFEEVSLRLAASRERNESYPVRGIHDLARDHAREYVWEVTHRPTGYAYTLETRLYDDGFAYRFILPGQGVRHVGGEAAEWRLPAEKEGFDLRDTVTTPWRVLIVAEDLDQLVNTDIVTNLSPAPDPALFADTSWIRPGRSLWSWWSNIDGRYMTVEGERAVIDLAADMGYEYSRLDEGWERLTNKWETLREMADYAAGKGVGLFVWRHWEKLNDPAEDYLQMRSFMDSVADCGVRGLKIDFMNGEGLRQIRFTTAVLENAARRRLLINFHGCQKPSGEIRTYPNELTREGVRGMELNRITANYLARMQAAGTPVADRPHVPGNENQNIPASHNAALPFTRCVAGPADYTPAGFSMPGDVLPVQQLACAYLITSPLMTLAENPFYLFREERLRPALEFLR